VRRGGEWGICSVLFLVGESEQGGRGEGVGVGGVGCWEQWWLGADKGCGGGVGVLGWVGGGWRRLEWVGWERGKRWGWRRVGGVEWVRWGRGGGEGGGGGGGGRIWG